MVKKALLICIDYKNRSKSFDDGEENAENYKEFLIDKGFSERNIKVMNDEVGTTPTRDAVLRKIDWLVDSAESGDSLFLVFSGHGGTDYRPDEYDPKHNLDGPSYISTLDRHIYDYELIERLLNPIPRGCRLTVILECCHGISMLPLQHVVLNPDDIGEADNYCHKQKGTITVFAGSLDWTKAYGSHLTKAFLAAMEDHPDASYSELFESMQRKLRRKKTEAYLLTSRQIESDTPFKL